MEVTFTCSNCSSAITVFPDTSATAAKCDICGHEESCHFNQEHMDGSLHDCPKCERKDFYKQKDFNRKVGVTLFVIAAIAAIWTYGISLIALWLVDFFLYKKLSSIAICYKCNTIFRKVKNMEELPGFNHEMNDRIVYSDHDFGGKPLEH